MNLSYTVIEGATSPWYNCIIHISSPFPLNIYTSGSIVPFSFRCFLFLLLLFSLNPPFAAFLSILWNSTRKTRSKGSSFSLSLSHRDIKTLRQQIKQPYKYWLYIYINICIHIYISVYVYLSLIGMIYICNKYYLNIVTIVYDFNTTR